MGTNPKPNYFVIILDSNGAIFDINPDGIDGYCRVHTLETQTWREGVLFELFVGIFGLILNLFW